MFDVTVLRDNRERLIDAESIANDALENLIPCVPPVSCSIVTNGRRVIETQLELTRRRFNGRWRRV